jgi:hypothetical protein
MMRRSGAALMRQKGKRRRSLDGEAKWRIEWVNVGGVTEFWGEEKVRWWANEVDFWPDRLMSTGRKRKRNPNGDMKRKLGEGE